MFGHRFDSGHLHFLEYQKQLKARKSLILRAFTIKSFRVSLELLHFPYLDGNITLLWNAPANEKGII